LILASKTPYRSFAPHYIFLKRRSLLEIAEGFVRDVRNPEGYSQQQFKVFRRARNLADRVCKIARTGWGTPA
jgi:hypothetical protein